MKLEDLINDDRPHVFDGAMGTMLYAKGVFINRCYDELNLREGDIVKEIHRAYVKAAAELIETNSFGANEIKLAEYNLDKQAHEINVLAAQHAKDAAGSRALVGGAIGPLGIRMEPYGPTSIADARAVFSRQAAGLAEGGVDFFILETFSDLIEIEQALLGIRDVSSLPVICQMTIQTDGLTLYGTQPQTFTTRLDEWGADVIGLNCSVGPAGVL